MRRDEEDSKNALLEVRSGSGGDEAAAFAKELFEMYRRFAELKGWKFEELHRSVIDAGEHGPERYRSSEAYTPLLMYAPAHYFFPRVFLFLSFSDAPVSEVFDRRFLNACLPLKRPVVCRVFTDWRLVHSFWCQATWRFRV